MVVTPEVYHLKPNKYAPNNDHPVLIYRDCLPLPFSEEKTTEFLESHAWVKKGTWGHIPVRHFHPNTHECYGKIPMLFAASPYDCATLASQAWFLEPFGPAECGSDV